MARLSTKYDSDLKEQVLVLRGDEGYARSTKTLLELGNPSIHEGDFDLPVTVNVLRDKGKGTILLYDNDVLVYTIDNWTAQDNARTVTLTGLAFDIQHNIVARYMGNNKCSPSHSTTETISVEDTRRATSTLTLETGTKQFHYNTSYSDTIILTNTISGEFNQNQSIEIRYDGTLIDTVTTNSEGKASFTIPDVGATGLHNISFHLEATRNLTTYDLSIDLSVGYKIEIINYSKVLVKNNDFIVQARVTDQFGNLFTPSSSEYDIRIITPTSEGSTAKWKGTVENGIITVNVPYTKYRSFGGYPKSFEIDISKLDPIKHYKNPEGLIPITYIEPEGFLFTPTVPRLYKNETNTLTAVVMPPTANIPVVLSGDVSETIYTNENGEATKSLMGTGVGSKTINAQFSSLSASVELQDYIQYWSPGDIHNKEYQVRQCSLDFLNNYFRINVNTAQGFLGVPIDKRKDYAMYIERVSSNMGFYISGLVGNYNEGWSQYASSQITVPNLTNATILLVKRGNTFKLTVVHGEGSYHKEYTVLSPQNAMGVSIMPSQNLQLTFEKLTLEELE